MAVPALADVSLTVYFPEPTQPAVRRTALRIADGRQAEVADKVKLAYRQNVVSAVLAERSSKPIVVVALGDLRQLGDQGVNLGPLGPEQGFAVEAAGKDLAVGGHRPSIERLFVFV